jgi:hypothetical protein
MQGFLIVTHVMDNGIAKLRPVLIYNNHPLCQRSGVRGVVVNIHLNPLSPFCEIIEVGNYTRTPDLLPVHTVNKPQTDKRQVGINLIDNFGFPG